MLFDSLTHQKNHPSFYHLAIILFLLIFLRYLDLIICYLHLFTINATQLLVLDLNHPLLKKDRMFWVNSQIQFSPSCHVCQKNQQLSQCTRNWNLCSIFFLFFQDTACTTIDETKCEKVTNNIYISHPPSLFFVLNP